MNRHLRPCKTILDQTPLDQLHAGSFPNEQAWADARSRLEAELAKRRSDSERWMVDQKGKRRMQTHTQI